MRADVATQRVILTAIWHTGTTGTLYNDPDPDYVTRSNPGRMKQRAVSLLESMGYTVTLNPAHPAENSQPNE